MNFIHQNRCSTKKIGFTRRSSLFKTATNLSRGVATTLMADPVSVAKIWTQKVGPKIVAALSKQKTLVRHKNVSTKNWNNVSIPMSSETSRLPNNKKYPTLSNHPLYSGHLFSFLGPRSFAPTHRPDSPKWFFTKNTTKKGSFAPGKLPVIGRKNLGSSAVEVPAATVTTIAVPSFATTFATIPGVVLAFPLANMVGFSRTGALEIWNGGPQVYGMYWPAQGFPKKLDLPINPTYRWLVLRSRWFYEDQRWANFLWYCWWKKSG